MKTASKQKLLAIIPASRLEKLRKGCNIVNSGGYSFILHKNIDNEEITVFKNRCAHQGGKFLPDVEDMHFALCTRHGWKFDGRTGHYTNPPPAEKQIGPCFVQETLLSAKTATGDLEVYDNISLDEENIGRVQFLDDGRLRLEHEQLELRPGELTVTYYGHACVIIKAGNFKIATDPWLIGDAFLGGWYPLHKPPKNWKSDLAGVDMIYISHRHPDHYSPLTLQCVAKLNPHIPVVVGNLQKGAVIDRYLPMEIVHKYDTGIWYNVADSLNIAILPDGALEDLDTSLLVEYKGHTIFNYVDCGNPNKGVLGKFDIVLGDFAAGASGYPVCMTGYSDDFIARKKKQMNATYLSKTIDILQRTKPNTFIPFAGYFTEARPSDERIRRLNTKNSVLDVAKRVSATFRNTVDVFVPIPGKTLDCSCPTSSLELPSTKHYAQYSKETIQECLLPYQKASTFPPFVINREPSLQFYFKWAGFCNYNLVLEIVECTEEFEPCEKSFFIDFREGLCFPDTMGSGAAQQWEKILVRQSAFRYALKHGLGWDSFFIGFSTRIERSPDVYHFAFWNHMSNLLPASPPQYPLP